MRYRYGCTLRPPTLGAIPRGAISFAKDPSFAFGTVDFPAPLDPEVARHLSLVDIGTDTRESNFADPAFRPSLEAIALHKAKCADIAREQLR